MIDNKLSIRPVIIHIGTVENKTQEEGFQNTTLRPILKLQHELLIAFFENYVKRKKIDFQGLSSEKKNDFVSNIFKNDNMFKTELRGMIIGQFTVSEFAAYKSISSDANKRILTMAKERLLSVFL
ncbi:glyoxalase [Lutimonas sp.]|uniref:glyoxalase n=1 Tax=Lutimonas sp. TaxID=1872403 RepID=UPI003C758202